MIAAKPTTISVCLPSYNGGKYIAAAIESALAQLPDNGELIVCDDDSSDETASVVEGFARQDARLKFTTNIKRLGLFANYNKCLTQAQGDYIKPFAQDDLLCPQSLRRMSEALDSDPEIFLVSGAKKIIDGSGEQTEQITTFTNNTRIAGKDVIMAHLITLSNWVGEPSAVMFRAKSMGDRFDTSFYHYGDIDYWLRIVEHGSMLYLSEPVCAFRRHLDSTTNNNLKGMHFACDIYRLGAKYAHYLDELGESSDHFGERATEIIARHVDHLVRENGLTAKTMLAASDRTNHDPSLDNGELRTALFYAQRRVTGLLKELIATKNALEHKEAECHELFEAYNQLENSFSWRLTAPLRAVRAFLTAPPTERQPVAESNTTIDQCLSAKNTEV